MTRLLSLLLLLALAGLQRSLAQTASFNFSLNPQSVSGWVNAHGDPSDTLITATAPSGISVSSVGATNWSRIAYTSDPCAYDGGGATGGTFFPAAVMLDHWFQYGTSTAAYNALLPQVIISGLNVDSVYTIKMTGSFVLGIPQYYTLNPIRYTVMGTINYGFIDIDGDSNTTAGAVFHNIAPDSTGKVRIFVNTYGGSNVASICGLQVISGQTAGVVPSVSLTKPTNSTILPEDANVAISATATETGGTIAEVQFYANGTLIGVDSTSPYSMTWISPDPGTYTITARAIDGTGGIMTSSANITIESLNYFWSTTGNIATNGDSSFVGTVDTNRLSFRTNNVERMTILKDGTVGIGTKVTDGYQLAVNGTAIFVKIKVKPLANWPDFVFGDTYKLPPLDSLEYYIRQYHHLPGVLSEQEEQHQGVDVAEQQAALLKKLEENTLYLIDQNKRLKTMTSRLTELDRQVRSLKRQNQRLTNALNKRTH